MAESDLHTIEARWQEIERWVDRTPGIDPWCSGPDWIIPAHQAFAPTSSVIDIEIEDLGIALLAAYETPEGAPMLAGLEPMWGFACPVLTRDFGAMAHPLSHALRDRSEWRSLVLPGLPHDIELVRALATPLSRLGEVRAMVGISNQIADLTQGSQRWLATKGSKFRRNLRRAERRAAERGLEFVEVSSDEACYERCRRIEGRSWKGAEGDGIVAPEMGDFYRRMVTRLRARDRLRAFVATLDGVDVGFILGGVRGRSYRGLQLSYVEEAAHLSVSHLLQWHQIQALDDPVGDGGRSTVDTYDLGMDMEYKRRWADRERPSISLAVERASPIRRRSPRY